MRRRLSPHVEDPIRPTARLTPTVHNVWVRMDGVLGAHGAPSGGGVRAHLGTGACGLLELDDRTVVQAFDAGEDAKTVWRAVWRALQLPASER
jgi:hypothetical protein